MSSLTKSLIASLLLIAGLSALGGCGNSQKNGQAVFYEDDAQHPANWLPAGHMAAAQANESACTQCHGSDYSGGISGVSCTLCHLGGVNSVHPVSWGTGSQVVPNHGAYVVSNGTTSCSNVWCHGSGLVGVTDSGPACVSCHLGGLSTILSGCVNCHGVPPNGSADPNVAGAHAVHNALPNVTNVCNTCHNGAGSGTVNHDNGIIVVQFLSVYSAESGTAIYNAADNTCSNVSCHGGQTTPVWLTGSLDVSTQCTSCHAYGNSEYNGFYSGQHYFHVEVLDFQCTVCHNVSQLAVSHFVSLNTPTVEGLEAPAALTIQSDVNFNPVNLTCTPSCHATQNW